MKKPVKERFCACGASKVFIRPAWFNNFTKARWVCVAKGCPIKTGKTVKEVTFSKAAKDWLRSQKWSLGNMPNWNMMAELERAFICGANWHDLRK